MLFEKLQKDYIEAFKAKSPSKGILNYVISQVKYKKIELMRDPTDEEIMAVIKKEIKTRQESMSFLEGKNPVEYEEEAQNIAILSQYLPKVLEESQLRELVTERKTELGIEDLGREKGKLIKSVMETHKAVIDGTMLQKVISELN